MKTKDLTGQRFGKLTVIERCEHIGNRPAWKCICDCGNIKFVQAKRLTGGIAISCGCNLSESKKTHGLSYTKIYTKWYSMLERCTTPSQKSYQNYGGRGITVCDEWKNFLNFYQWAMETGYKDGLTLERKDVNGNYCPENCCWITIQEQSRNKRNNVYLTFNGKTMLKEDWARELGIKSNVIGRRLKRGWTVEEALTIPINPSKRIWNIRKTTKEHDNATQ